MSAGRGGGGTYEQIDASLVTSETSITFCSGRIALAAWTLWGSLGLGLLLAGCAPVGSIDAYRRGGVINTEPSFVRLDLPPPAQEGEAGPKSTAAFSRVDACQAAQCVVGLHGFMYDPTDPGLYNPHFTVYHRWQAAIPPGSFVAIGWHSVTLRASDLVTAWSAGTVDWYGLARQRARNATPHIIELLRRSAKPLVVVCHSLGCHMALHALAATSTRTVKRVVMLNAAVEMSDFTKLLPRLKGISLVNIYVPGDGALGLAGRLHHGGADVLIGRRGIDEANNSSVVDVRVCPVDEGSTTPMSLENPNRFGNHMYTFEGPGMSHLLRRAISGDLHDLHDRNCGERR